MTVASRARQAAALVAAALVVTPALAPPPRLELEAVEPTELEPPELDLAGLEPRRPTVPDRARLVAADCRQVVASYYGAGERLNVHAADGSVFDPTARTVAHRTIPLGEEILVDGLPVTVTDRGPAPWTGADVDLAAVGVWDALELPRGAGHVTVELCRLP